MVNCLLGGYDGRFDQGENSKENFERRTPSHNWSVDRSNYALKVQESDVHLIEDPVLRAVVIQELSARKARKTYKRTTRPADFSEASWHEGW